jgi:hypothetical protein
LARKDHFKPGSRAVTRNPRPAFSSGQKTWTHFRDEQAAPGEGLARSLWEAALAAQ